MRTPFFASLLLLGACGGGVTAVEETTPTPGGSATGAAPTTPGDLPPEPTEACAPPTGVETVADLRGDGNLAAGRLVVDDRHVFVDTNRGTFRIRKCGGAPGLVAANDPGQYTAVGLVLDPRDARYLYLASNAPMRGGFVRRIAKDGSGATDIATTPKEAFGLAYVDDGAGSLFWINRGQSSDTLMQQGVRSGQPSAVATLATAVSYDAFAADPGGVSFLANGSGASSGSYFTYAPKLGVRPIASGAAAMDAVLGPPDSIGEATAIYAVVSHTTSNGVARIPRDGSAGSPTILAPATAPMGIARRGQVLYFTDASTGDVSSCVLDRAGTTCDVRFPTASGEDDPRFIVADEQAIYWATRRGLIRRAPL